MFVVIAATSACALGADKEDSIRADRALLAGEWRVVSVEANGNTNADPMAARVTIVNELDGKWSLLANGKTIAEGTSTIDPTTSPKTIELKSSRNFASCYEVAIVDGVKSSTHHTNSWPSRGH
jgi:uncharacterized protein (TIGR03067 family)